MIKSFKKKKKRVHVFYMEVVFPTEDILSKI